MNYSPAATIPSPQDVQNYPLSLFINSVLNCDTELFNRVDASNYKSFVAALSKSTLSASKNVALITKIRYAANTLLATIVPKIDYDKNINEIRLLILMSNLDAHNLDKFYEFKAQVNY